MSIELGILIVLWALTLNSLSTLLNSKSRKTLIINSIIGSSIFVASLVITTHYIKSSISYTRSDSIKEKFFPETADRLVQELETQPLIEEPNAIPPKIESQLAPPTTPISKATVVTVKTPKKSVNKKAIYSFVKTAKSLVNRGRSYITQLNTINLDNVEQLSDFEYDALVSKTKALKKKVDYYFYEVKKLRAPNKHGYAFKKVLLQAAHDIKKSAQTVDTFMNNDEIENENELVELHHNHMESAHNRMKELQRSL